MLASGLDEGSSGAPPPAGGLTPDEVIIRNSEVTSPADSEDYDHGFLNLGATNAPRRHQCKRVPKKSINRISIMEGRRLSL